MSEIFFMRTDYNEGFDAGYKQGINENIEEHKKINETELMIKYAEMFFRWWYEFDIKHGAYSEEEIKNILNDFLEENVKENKNE